MFDDPWWWGWLTVSCITNAAALVWVDAPRWLSVGMGLPVGLGAWLWWTSLDHDARRRKRAEKKNRPVL